MKNMTIIAAFAILNLVACSKSSLNPSSQSGSAQVVTAASVPAPVIASFNSSFNGATNVEWFRGTNSFTSQFNLAGQRHEAGFDDNGHQSSHSVICTDGAVPSAVLEAFRQRFSSDNVYQWKLTNEGTWKAHFMRGAVKFEATFSAAGALIKFEQAG